MTIASRELTSVAVVSLLIVGVPAVGDAPPAPGADEAGAADRLTQPTLVTLDFRDRPIAEVVAAIAQRSGKWVFEQDGFRKDGAGEGNAQWGLRRIRLEAPDPVPFWEAIDRLAEAGRVGREMTMYGHDGRVSTAVLVGRSGGDDGQAYYAGPFRVGLLGVHEHRDVVFVRGPWVQITAPPYPV